MGGTAHDNYPLYQNDEDQYLYYWGASRGWKIGSNYTSSAAGVTSLNYMEGCPDAFSSWSLFYDGSWNEAQRVSVACGTKTLEFQNCMDLYGPAQPCLFNLEFSIKFVCLRSLFEQAKK